MIAPPNNVLLVGAGVVGRAIAADHLRHRVPVWIADRDEAAVHAAAAHLSTSMDAVITNAKPSGLNLPLSVIGLEPTNQCHPVGHPWLLIESIAERLDVKTQFFRDAEAWFEQPAVLTTNTSTLSIGSIASEMRHPEQLCGLHFFMPVVGRPAVEVISHETTSQAIIQTCFRHASRIAKTPLLVADHPGFVVNRLLVPYLNLAMWLLCGGVDCKTLRSAALRYGMPISPLELIDYIGARTAFDGGRVVWQAFPHRIHPSPLLPAMVKRGRLGRAIGKGFYHYDSEGRRISDALDEEVQSLIERYRHQELGSADPESIRNQMAEAIRSEAAFIVADGTSDQTTIDSAMALALGYHP